MSVNHQIISNEIAHRYVFVNADNVVVQAIDGDLTQDDLAVFLRDYAILFGATEVFTTDASLGIMAGWRKEGDNYIPQELPPPVGE